MNRSPLLLLALALGLLAPVWSGCSGGGDSQPGPSKVGAPYKGRLPDDTMVEASTTVLATTAVALMALDCKPLAASIQAGDQAAIDKAVAAGIAARLPANVTIYTPPFSDANPKTSPFVVTDDKYAGYLCTPDAYKVVKS